jgi:hypothetical protein
MVISTLFISVDTLTKPFQDLAIEQKINEKVLSKNESNELVKIKQNNKIKRLSQNYQTSFESAENANLELDIYFNEIGQLNALEYLAVQENQIDLSYANSDARSRNAAIKIQKIIYKYISSHFGPQYNPTTLTETQFLQLEGFVESNKKINDLYAILEGQYKNLTVEAEAAWWENCSYETVFNEWLGYQVYSYYGYRANWVGRTATDNAELNGNSPCDFSFYLDTARVNKVYAWSIATRCALRYSGGISMRRYGWSNMKAIIGHGRLTICGVYSINTGMLRDQVRFY